jgi:hypothetical protein
MAGVLSIGFMAAPAAADSGSPAHNLWHWICGCDHGFAPMDLHDVIQHERAARP